MSKVYLCSFSDQRMSISQQRLTESAYKFGVDEVIEYREKNLPTLFVDLQSELLKQEKGYGYYCWKPAVVAEVIYQLEDGDLLIYCDAGNEFISSVQPIIRAMWESRESVFLFSNGWPHIDWCKRDCLVSMLPGISDVIDRSWKQVQASTIFFRVSDYSRNFCKRWLAWSLIPGMIDNEPSILPNHASFSEHRWDQSILTNLQIADNLPLHFFPTTTALHLKKDYPGDNYPILLNHHRKRDWEWQ